MNKSINSYLKKLFIDTFVLSFALLSPLVVSAKEASKTIVSNYPKTTVILNPCYKTPASLKKADTLHIQGLGYGEYIELKVIGSVQNVRLVQLVYNEDSNCLEESATTASVAQLTNQTLIVSTNIPCGMAQEKLIWQSLSGTEDSFLIAEDGQTSLKSLTFTYQDPFVMPKLLAPPALPVKFISPADIPAQEVLYFMVPLFTN